jgi:hypothetical protein
VLTEYAAHPEPKSASVDCANPRKAIGLLERRHVMIVRENISYIGKESNQREEVEAELEHCLNDVLEEYTEPSRKRIAPETLEALRKIPSRELTHIAGVSPRFVRAVWNGHRRPSDRILARMKKCLD